MKVYKYKSGKFQLAFDPNFETIEQAERTIQWYFESRRGDRATQFVVADDDKIIKLVTNEIQTK